MGSEPETPLLKLGRFEIRELVGEGGFGLVYRAYDPHLERELALKVPRPGTLKNQQRVRRFHEDARSAAQLNHPNIVPVYDAGESEGKFYIASKFVQGGTLAQAIADAAEQEQRFDIPRAVGIVLQLAEALAYAHSLGVIHRDIKPANILLDEKGTPHVIDFGLAHRKSGHDLLEAVKEAEAHEPSSDAVQHTRIGAVIGTVPYLSPEAAAGRAHEATPAMDQYSLGIVLYELLVGERPFHGSIPEMIRHHIQTPAPALREQREEVSRDLQAICLKCLEKNPADRYPTCAELAADLRRYLEHRPVSVRKRGLGERLWRWLGDNRFIGFLLLVTAASLLIGLTASLWFAWTASVEARRADRQMLLEQAARQQADRKTEEADRARLDKDQALQRILRDQYFNLIARTEREIRDGQPTRAQDLLQQANQLKTPLGWEWHHLKAEADALRLYQPAPWTLAILSAPNGGSDWLAWSESHRVILRRCVAMPASGDVLVLASENERSAVSALALSQEGAYLAVGHESGVVGLYEKQGDHYACRQHHKPGTPRVTAIDVTETGQVAWGCANGVVGYLESPTAVVRLKRDWHTNSLRSVRFTPLGNQFITCCASAVLRLNGTRDLSLELDRPLESVTAAGILLDSVAIHPRTVPVPGPPPVVPARQPIGTRPRGAVLPLLADATAGLKMLLEVYAVLSGAPPGRGFVVPGLVPLPEPMATPVPAPMPAGEGRRMLLPRIKYRIVAKAGGVQTVLDTAFREQAHFRGHHHNIIALYTSSHGDRIASLDETGIFKLWRIQDHDTIEMMTQRTDGGFALDTLGSAVAWSEGVRTIKYRQINGVTLEFNRFTGHNLTAQETQNDGLTAHTGYIHAVAYSGQGQHPVHLITAGSKGAERIGVLQGELRVWDGNRYHLQNQTTDAEGAEMRCVDATARGRVAWAGASGKIRLGNVSRPGEALLLAEHVAEVKALRFHPAGFRLASGGLDTRVVVWDENPEDGTIGRQRTFTDSPGPILSLGWSADGQRLFAGNDRGDIFGWRIVTGQREVQFRHGSKPLPTLALDMQGRFLVSGSNDGSIQIRDALTGEERTTIAEAHRNGVLSLAFLPDGTRLASVGGDQTIRLWEVGTWREALTLPGRVGLREGLAFYPEDARELAVATVEGVRLLRTRP